MCNFILKEQFLLEAHLGCAHNLPCVPGEKCKWLEWSQLWVNEMRVIDGENITDHATRWFPGQHRREWKPDSWAAWSKYRQHECEEHSDFDDDDNARQRAFDNDFPDEELDIARAAARGRAHRVRQFTSDEDPAYVQTLMAMERITGYRDESDAEEESGEESDEGDDEGDVDDNGDVGHAPLPRDDDDADYSDEEMRAYLGKNRDLQSGDALAFPKDQE